MIITYNKTDSITDTATRKDICNKIYLTATEMSVDSFEVEFRKIKKEKTYNQLKGIHKLCSIYQDYISEACGYNIPFENAKENLKYEIGYTRLCSQDEAIAVAMQLKREKSNIKIATTLKEFNKTIEDLQKYYQVPASFADASLEKMQELIKAIHQLGIERKWYNLVLNNEDMQSLINSYK